MVSQRHNQPDLVAGRYRIDERLSWGGLATYYRASDGAETVLLATLAADPSTATGGSQAFEALTETLKRIRIQQVPRLQDAGLDDGVPFLVYEWQDGTLLSDHLRAGPPDSLQALHIASDVLRAVAAGHDAGLLHADITPQNILVLETDAGPEARLLGFGIAPFLRDYPAEAGGPPRTGSGQHAVAYMAPELFGGQTYRHHADLYSVGALLHHLLCGAAPIGWEAQDGFEDVPGLPEVVMRAMKHRPEARYKDAVAMLTALEWLDVESAKRNPATQDIPLWMERSFVGSIPIPALASSVPPVSGSSAHAPGTILSAHQNDDSTGQLGEIVYLTTNAQPAPESRRLWLQMLGLLIALAALLFAALAWDISTT